METLDIKKVARALTIIENGLLGSEEILKNLKANPDSVVVGITGPPGAGKSSLINEIITLIAEKGKNVAVLAIDPTSPFNFGSLLGDRIRMGKNFNNDKVYIRSVASRGSLGGLAPKVIEMVEVLKSAWFDYIFIETVGVGQSEVEIAGLADACLVVLVPEAGDEIQSMKSGLMEIADIFIVNKSDREGAENFANNLRKMTEASIPVVETTAINGKGTDQLLSFLQPQSEKGNVKKKFLYTEKAWQLIQQKKMEKVDKKKLQHRIAEALDNGNFNLYGIVNEFIMNS